MDLSKLQSNIPLKALPPKVLADGLIVLGVYIAELVHLKPNKGNDLKDALKGVEDICKNYGFKEITTIFELYRDSQLDMKPITNHIDRILVGQILQAYQKHKPEQRKPKTGGIEMAEKLEKEREQQDYIDVISWFDWFIQHRKVTKKMTWIYEYLILKDKHFIPKKKFEYKLTQTGIDDGMSIENAKSKTNRTMIGIYFEMLENKGIHIRNLL